MTEDLDIPELLGRKRANRASSPGKNLPQRRIDIRLPEKDPS
jgi:hypothetical protein